ncbi:hypothetical protein M404DRAFT_540526 [Pisolithus tinctorius Marx 270]|uniref:Uncharacterized protein n=1 Tax=Pisolithus tinctorius Marx 270 TaxID=870435 RepID=A0A0C3K5G0_PISTI|nr:hypothetical protein M404DRAFT_540526 [Pisolithus tinctorius Marx 270]
MVPPATGECEAYGSLRSKLTSLIRSCDYHASFRACALFYYFSNHVRVSLWVSDATKCGGDVDLVAARILNNTRIKTDDTSINKGPRSRSGLASAKRMGGCDLWG